MAAGGTKWRTKCRVGAVLFAIFIQVINGYEETYTISQLSPKSVIDNQLPDDVVLQTSQTENLDISIEPSIKYLDDIDDIPPEDVVREEEEEKHIIVARSADPNRESRSINIEEIPVSNNNEIDNELEIHNKRKYYEIHPTKTIDYLRTRDDDEILMSEGFGDRLEFRFPGEGKRVPKARALTPSGPKIRPTAVQPIFATATPREQGRQNTEIQNIITGIVKLLNGNVNVQANSQLLNGRPGRPMASRINNRGPPRISDVPPLPEFDKITPPPHAYHPTKTPPPYPFDRPPHHGVNLPEQIVPPMSYRPGLYRPIPPWQRPRPRPPTRRPNPGLPMYKPMPPLPPDLPDLEDSKPEEDAVSENETSQSENKIHHDDKETVTTNIVNNDERESTPVVESPETNSTELDKEVTVPETTTSSTTTTTTTTTPSTTTSTTTTTEKPTTTEKTTTTEKPTTTTEKPKTEKPMKPEKKKESEKEKLNKEKYKPDEKVNNKTKNDNIFDSLLPSMVEIKTSTASIATPTPTEGLISHAPTTSVSSSPDEVIKTSSLNSQPPPTSQGIPYHPYRPRPGIVLDDPDFKPKGTRYPVEVPVITAAETRLPGYGEIFNVTVSAIQGPGGIGASVPPLAPPPLGPALGTGVAIPADDELPVRPPPKAQPTHHGTSHYGPPHSHGRPQNYGRPPSTVRIDTCIVGDDSTCDHAQNEMCRTEAGISSCQCRPGYAKRTHRDPCRRVVSLLLNLRVDRLYDRTMTWDNKLADKESDLYQQLSYEAIRAIDSAFSMTPFSDEFVGVSVNGVHRGDVLHPGVFLNYTVLMQETQETLRSAIATDIQKHILGVIRRRSNNVGASALWVETPAGSVLPLKDVDECASPELNDCHNLAVCTNTWGGFRCACSDTTLDVSVGRAGRACRACSSSHCNERGVCRYQNSQPHCSCTSGYYGSTCEVDGETVGVAVGVSLAALLVIGLTLAALLAWSRKWSREQKAAGMGSPVFNYMAANTIKTPPVGQPPYQVTLEERMRWAQIAEAMAQANHYAQPEPAQAMVTRPSSAMFGGYPTLPPVPLPRMGLHGGHHTGTLNTLASRANTAASHHNLYGYTNHMATESTSSEASSHVQDRTDLLVPRPKSRARSMHNQTGIYYDVDYENTPEAIYGSKGIPLSTYTVSRGPPFYRA